MVGRASAQSPFCDQSDASLSSSDDSFCKPTKFLKNRTNILLKDKLLPDFCHGFLWSEENVDLNYF